MHCTTRSVLTFFLRPTIASSSPPPSFLTPSLSLPITQTKPFSSTASHNARKDRNPKRGISALRHTGLRKRQTLSVKLSALPKPVLDPRRRSAVEVNPEHGLYDFFNADRSSMMTPKELQAHGRAWIVSELRRKDWDDVWRLWWVCVKERNRVMTFLAERERLGGQMGGYDEASGRMREIKKTMKAISHVLTERWYAWDNARYAAMEDPEVNLYAAGTDDDPAYIPAKEEEQLNAIEDETEPDAEPTTDPQNAPQVPPPDQPRTTSEARI